MDALDALVGAITQRLRFLSGQVELPRRIIAINQVEGDAPAPVWPTKIIGRCAHLAERCYGRPLTEDIATRAGESAEVPPPFHFLMDAAQAAIVGDHSQAILYAAMSVEAAAQLQIDVLANAVRRDDPRFRVREADGRWEDPVLKVLRKSGFARLFHEVPVYLLGKSMKMDALELHQAVTKLKNTRDKLAHTADADGPNVLSIDSAGSRCAVDTAIGAFEWWGLPALRFAPAVAGRMFKVDRGVEYDEPEVADGQVA